jgi:hypothetical protein
MTQNQIDGGKQVRAGTITATQISSTAAITDGMLAAVYLYANGTRALTGNLQGGGFEATNFLNPSTGTSLATKSYVDAVAQGLTPKPAARAATVGTETFTISGGNVTTINGTGLDGITIAVNDYVLVKDSPASSGVGSAMSSQPGNGLYKCTNATTNLTLARAAEMSGTNGPAGASVFVEGGTANASAGYVVSVPNTNSGFVYGTNNIQWTQFSGAGEITVDASLTKTGNQLGRAALTGDVTATAGANATTIAAAAVTLAKMANLAANSVIGNSTGSAATPTALALASAATASAVAIRDINANLAVNNLIEGSQTIATTGGTTTLTVSSPELTQFTGTTTQTAVMPNATTMANGQAFTIANRSTGVVTVNANGGGLLQTMAAASQCTFTLINNGTSAGTWDVAYSITNAGAGGGSVTSVGVASANGFNGTVANATTTPVITILTTITGLLKGNGTAVSAASNTAGADYVNSTNFIVRETPSGTVNGSNTTFTLANTPIAGTEQVYLNGLQQEPGAGNDYTISGATITYLTAPLAGDKVRVSYMK